MKEVATPALPVKKNNGEIQIQDGRLAAKLWQGNLTDNQKVALWSITRKYNLDPLLKQIIVLGDNFYINKGGIRKIAGDDPNPPDGIQTFPANEQERKDYGCVHSDPSDRELYEHLFKGIIQKKGCAQPFIEWGMASFSNVTLHNKDHRLCADMAKTRATNRALRNAYEIGLTSWEEVEGTSPEFNQEDAGTLGGDDLDPEMEVEQDGGTVNTLMTKKQNDMVNKILKSHVFNDDRTVYYGRLLEVENKQDLEEIIDEITSEVKKRKDAEREPA